MVQSQKGIKRYLKEIGKEIPVSGKQKKKFIAYFKEAMSDFLATNENANYDKLVSYFGKPADVSKLYANAWQEEIEDEMVRKNQMKHILIGICVLVIAICLVLLTSGFMYVLANEINCYVVRH